MAKHKHKISRVRLWTGWIITLFVTLFLLFDSITKIFMASYSVEGTTALGYSELLITPLGIVLFMLTILYIIPKTSVLGAVLLTGWFGGAAASHIIAGQNWFWFPILFGILSWLGIWIKDERLRVVFPWQKWK